MEVAHSAEYDSKSSLANVRNVLNAIFNKKHSRKKRADCCRLLPVIALIYFELHFFREPFDPAPVIADIKALMQKTHPDKVAGYEAEFDQLNKALKYARSKVNLLKTPHKKLNLGR